MFWRKKKPKFHASQVTDANFNELVTDAKAPVVLDFFASWCGPCKILGPFIDEMAEEYEGRALVAKVDVDANPSLVQHFKIKSMPTILYIHKGQVVERFQGLVPKPNLVEILDAYLAED